MLALLLAVVKGHKRLTSDYVTYLKKVKYIPLASSATALDIAFIYFIIRRRRVTNLSASEKE